MAFRLLEHTADVQAECTGATFEELLESAAQALYAVALTETRDARDVECHVAVMGNTHEELLVRWLQELIFLLDTNAYVAAHYVFEGLRNNTLKATVHGYACRPDERAQEVKSATYHELKVTETAEGYLARVIFDL